MSNHDRFLTPIAFVCLVSCFIFLGAPLVVLAQYVFTGEMVVNNFAQRAGASVVLGLVSFLVLAASLSFSQYLDHRDDDD